MKIYFVIGSALLFVAGSVLAEPVMADPAQVAREYEQRTWRHEHGLPDDRVSALLQTRDGYLWVATPGGLARFDGQRFTVFNKANTPGLPANECVSLAEDIKGNLWVGTRLGVVRKTGSDFMLLGKADGLRKNYPSQMRASHFGGMWAFWSGYVSLIQPPQTRNYCNEKGLPVETLLALLEDANGVVWLGGHAGLMRFDPKTDWFESTPLKQEFERLPIVGILAAEKGEHWVLFTERVAPPYVTGPKAWLACFKDGQWVRQPNLGKPDLQGDWRSPFLVADQFGALWLPAMGSALHRFINNRFELLRMPHVGDQDIPLCVCSDREGNLWVGTSDGGLQRWSPKKTLTYRTREGLPDDNTWTICESRDGSILIGTDGGVTRWVQGRLGSLYSPADNTQKMIRSIVESPDGTIWIGTMRTLLSYRNGILSEHKLPGKWDETKIRVLLAARDGALWVGTVRGLTCLKEGERIKYTTAEGLAANEVLALWEDRSGDLWVGTSGGGLSRWHNGRFSTLTTTNGLCSNNVWALHQDSDDVLWIGTDNGLNRLKDGKLTAFTTVQGLPDNQVNSILEDDAGRLWVGYDHGIYWVRKQQLDAVADKGTGVVLAVQYDETDGLLSTETNGQKSNPAACKSKDGRLWFATTRGVAIIDPAKVITDDIAPLTVIEQVRVNGQIILGTTPNDCSAMRAKGQAVAPGTVLRLDPGTRVVEFRYTANTFVAPEKTRFRYRLLGLDNHWMEADDRREAYFTDLSPGDYQFEVTACNHHGVWQERGAMIGLHLTPFFYQSVWFYVSCGTSAAVLVALVVGWRVRELRKLQRLEAANALNEQRKQIARDIHDELGASLTQIVQLSAQTRKASGQSEPVDLQMGRIASVAEEAVDNIGEIVWANNPEYDTLEDLVAYLREYAANFFAESSTHVRFDFPETVPPQTVRGHFRRHLLLLVKEALHNVMKHAKATAVQMRLAAYQERLELEIADNGCGLETAQTANSGNGMANMRHRVAELKGSLALTSQPGTGTRIKIVVPMG